jgi:hypothetical protein
MVSWSDMPPPRRPGPPGPAGRALVAIVLNRVQMPRVWAAMTPSHWIGLGRFIMWALPDDEAVRGQMADEHPGWAEQADAAADEAWKLANDVEYPGRVRAFMIPDDAARAAMRGQACRVLAGISGGAMAHCRHIDPAAPRPMFATAWGSRVDCQRCLPLYPDQVPTPTQARTCYLCARVGLSPAHLATPTIGMVAIMMGVCGRCIARLATTAEQMEDGR